MTKRFGTESAQRIVADFSKVLHTGSGTPANEGIRTGSTGEQFIGASSAFINIVETIDAVAARRCPVVVLGETGTGKEMVARQIHLHSDRNGKPFVPVDCTTLTGQLFESQLFGHVKGAFTGAVDNTLGFFRAADEGTIFLDEIGEVPLEMQAKLLRVLQEGTVTPLGATKSYHVDVRVLCATNRDLRDMVRQGTFRADLYYRLNVVAVELPPLRQRQEDILILADYFLARQAGFYNETPKVLSDAAKKLILNYSWPGNIRELANAMERAYVLSTMHEIQPAVLPMDIVVSGVCAKTNTIIPTIEEAKRQLVIRALEHTRCRKSAAANLLGIERRALNRLLARFQISLSQIKHTNAKN